MLTLFRNRWTSIFVPKLVAGAPAAETQVVQDFLEPSENETKRLLQTAELEEAELKQISTLIACTFHIKSWFKAQGNMQPRRCGYMPHMLPYASNRLFSRVRGASTAPTMAILSLLVH